MQAQISQTSETFTGQLYYAREADLPPTLPGAVLSSSPRDSESHHQKTNILSQHRQHAILTGQIETPKNQPEADNAPGIVGIPMSLPTLSNNTSYYQRISQEIKEHPKAVLAVVCGGLVLAGIVAGCALGTCFVAGGV